jgi:biopolymer transport protein ExbB/TolQ
MAQCPNCGSTTTPDHSFCLNCGAELSSAAGRSSQQPAAEAAEAAPARGAAAPEGRPAPRGRETRPRRRRAAGEAALPALVALVASLALQQIVNSVIPAGSYIHRIFRPQGGWIMSVVPALIFFIFIWTLTDLLLKLRVARANEADLARSDVNQVPNLVRQEPTSVVLQRLRVWDLGVLARPVGRRVLWLLQHLDTVDAQRAHELTRHQSDLETDTAASGYRTVRLFIWAMPILGFIGTVLGISIAVGGFSDFLTTNVSIDEIDRVTAELGNVAGGLSFAFDTTLLGLLAGLVSSVASTAVQGKEERFLTGLEELGLRIMENAQPLTAAAVGGPAGAAVGEEFDAMMRTRIQELSSQMQQFTRAVQSGLDGFLVEWGKLPPEVERAAGDLAGLREQLTSAAKSTDKMILETRLLLEGLNESSTQLGNRLNSSIGSISHTVDGLGESLGGVSQTLQSSLAGLGEQVQSSERHLEAGMTGLRDAIEASKRDDGAIQAALEQLTSTIAELAGTLEGMRPLLSQLSGPLELRLMPTPMASPQQR